MSTMKLETEARFLNSQHVGERVRFSPEPGVVVEDTLTAIRHGEMRSFNAPAYTTEFVWLAVAHLTRLDSRDFQSDGWQVPRDTKVEVFYV